MSTFPVKNEFSFRGFCPGTHCIGGSAFKILRAAMNERMASGWASALRVLRRLFAKPIDIPHSLCCVRRSQKDVKREMC